MIKKFVGSTSKFDLYKLEFGPYSTSPMSEHRIDKLIQKLQQEEYSEKELKKMLAYACETLYKNGRAL